METAPRYALRQRHIKRGFRSADEPAGGAAHDEATTVATVAVGLKPGEMTKLERQLFGSRIKDYLRSRYVTMFSTLPSTALSSRWHHRLCMKSMYLQPVGPSSAGTRFLSSGMRTARMQWTCINCWVSFPGGFMTAWPTPAQWPCTHHGRCTVAFVAPAAHCKQGLLQARPGVHGAHTTWHDRTLLMPPVCPAADEPDSSMQVLRDAYYFLQENGYINFGVLKGVQGLARHSVELYRAQKLPHGLETLYLLLQSLRLQLLCCVAICQPLYGCVYVNAERPPPVTEEAAAAAAEEQEADEPKSPFEDDKAIAFKLYELLRVADMEVGGPVNVLLGAALGRREPPRLRHH